MKYQFDLIFCLFEKKNNSYFDSDDDEDQSKKSKVHDDLDYQPAPGSPSYRANKKKDDDDDDEDEDDPLEQFMRENNSQAKKDLENMGRKKDKKTEKFSNLK